MANFCKYCGTQLADGQVCGCPQAQAAAQQQAQPQQPQQPPQQQYTQQPQQQQYAQPQQPYQQQQYQQQPYQQPQYQQQAPAAPRAPSPVGVAFKNLGPFLKAYFASPVEATRTAVRQKDWILSLILMVIQAIVAGLMMFAIVHTLMGKLMENGWYTSHSVSFIMCLIYGFLMAVVAIALFMVLVFALAKILHSSCSFVDALTACGASSLFVTILLLVTFLLFLLSFKVGFVLFVISMVSWVIMGVSTVQALDTDTGKSSFWMLYIVFVLVTQLVCGWLVSATIGMPIGATKVYTSSDSYTLAEDAKRSGVDNLNEQSWIKVVSGISAYVFMDID